MNERDDNREKMPNVAEIVDQFRAAGFTFRVTAAHDFETGFRIGDFDGQAEEVDKESA